MLADLGCRLWSRQPPQLLVSVHAQFPVPSCLDQVGDKPTISAAHNRHYVRLLGCPRGVIRVAGTGATRCHTIPSGASRCTSLPSAPTDDPTTPTMANALSAATQRLALPPARKRARPIRTGRRFPQLSEIASCGSRKPRRAPVTLPRRPWSAADKCRYVGGRTIGYAFTGLAMRGTEEAKPVVG